jgi:type I restriction enzyme S subunit
MDAQKFLAEFGHIANAPGGVARLRELIFELTGQGRLLEDCEPIEPIPLGKVAEFIMGQAPPGVECNTNGNGVVFIKTGEFGEIYPVIREWTTKPLKFARQGDVLICVVGATIGKLNLGIDCAIGRSVAAIRPNFGLQTKYLFYSLMPFTLHLRKGSRGSAQGVIGKSELSAVLLRVPGEIEQSRIVAKVDELMALCDKLEAQQQARRILQNALRQTTLQAVAAAASPHELQTTWARLAGNFGQFFRVPEDLNDLEQCINQCALKGLLTSKNSGEQLPQTITELACSTITGVSDSEMDWSIPSHWIWAKCEWLGEARLGKMLDAAKNKGDFRPYLRNVNVRWGRFDFSDVLKMRVEDHELPRISIQKGDLVICEGGEPGRSAIWEKDEEFVIQKALHRFRCNGYVLPEYMLFCLKHDFFSGRLSRYYTGATIKHLTGKALAEYSIPLPPIEEQKRILAAAKNIANYISALKGKIDSANHCAGKLATAAVSTLTGITPEQEPAPPMKLPQTELIAPLRLGQSPDIKAQAPLAAILAHHNGALNAKELWQRFGGDIDAFYAQLKIEVAHGWIVEPEPAEMRVREAQAG